MKGFNELHENGQFEKVKPAKARVELLRKIDDPKFKEFIAKVDAATSVKEVERVDRDLYDIVPNLRDYKERIGGLDAFWTFHDLAQAKIRELNKIARDEKNAAKVKKETEKQAAKDAVQATFNKHMELPELKKALDEIGADFRKEIADSIEKRYEVLVAKYFDEEGKSLIVMPKNPSRSEYNRIQSLANEFVDLVAAKRLKPNWKSVVKQIAEDTAKMRVQAFTFKMAMKLGEVIDRKGGATIKRFGNLTNHELYLTFPDGSGFSTRSQQVLSVSVNGKLFARYPTTFHDVTFKDGSKMKTPSAAKMQAEFGISDLEVKDEQ